MDLNGFDANEVEPQQSFEPLPAGWYTAEIIESKEKPTRKNPNNSYLELTLEIVEGEHKSRRLWERLNLNNDNQTAAQIAQRTLSSICHATGIMAPKNSEQLHYKKMAVRVIQKAGADGEVRNEIKQYKAVEGGQPIKAAPPKPSAPEKKAPPWQRKAG